MNIGTIFDGIAPGARAERGFAGEFFARKQLENSGYVVEHQTKKKRGDLKVVDPETGELWRVEVKTARRRPDGRWCFQIRVAGHTDCGHSDYVILLAILGGGKVASYLIPVRALGHRNTITISNVNSGMWTDYRIKRTVKLL